ncbi:MAG: hypothetical protein ACLP05_03245 [Candidatus Kryptoniota bacterium]
MIKSQMRAKGGMLPPVFVVRQLKCRTNICAKVKFLYNIGENFSPMDSERAAYSMIRNKVDGTGGGRG